MKIRMMYREGISLSMLINNWMQDFNLTEEQASAKLRIGTSYLHEILTNHTTVGAIGEDEEKRLRFRIFQSQRGRTAALQRAKTKRTKLRKLDVRTPEGFT